MLKKNLSVMNNKEEEYFFFSTKHWLLGWLVIVGCDPKPLNVTGSRSLHFSGADLRGALLWLILISQVSPAVLGVSQGWLCSIVQAQRRLSGQWRDCALNRDINRATKHNTFLLIGNGQQERGKGK